MPVEHFSAGRNTSCKLPSAWTDSAGRGRPIRRFSAGSGEAFAVWFQFGEEHFAEIELIRRPVPWIEIAVGFVASVDDVALGAQSLCIPRTACPRSRAGLRRSRGRVRPERGNHVDPLARDALAEVETGAVVLIVHDGFSARGGDCVEEVADVEIGAVFSACGVLHDIPGLDARRNCRNGVRPRG